MTKIHKYLLNREVSLKENTLWFTMGTLCSSATSVLLMVYVTHLLGVDEAGVYSIAYSIAQLMLTIGWFGTRQFQVSDVEEEYSFSDYFTMKIITSCVALLGGLIYAGMLHLNAHKFMITFLYCSFIVCDIFADLFSARFQQEDRLYLSGISYILRIGGYNVIFLVSLFIFRSLFISILLAFIYSLVELILFDYPFIKRMSDLKVHLDIKKIMNLFKNCFPLFISSFVSTFIVNIPKNAIELNLSSSIQTYYNIIFMPSSIVNMFCMFIFVPMYTQIAKKWHEDDKKSFIKVVQKVFLIAILFSVFVFVGCALLGIPFLEILYGVNLDGYKTPFLILIGAGCLTSINSILSYIMTVMRKQQYILYIYIVALVVSQVCIQFLITRFGFVGASIDYLIGMLCITIFMFVIFIKTLNRKK